MVLIAATATAVLLAVLAWRWLNPPPVAGEQCSRVDEEVCVDGIEFVCHQDQVECGGGNCIGAMISQLFAEGPTWTTYGRCDQ